MATRSAERTLRRRAAISIAAIVVVIIVGLAANARVGRWTDPDDPSLQPGAGIAADLAPPDPNLGPSSTSTSVPATAMAGHDHGHTPPVVGQLPDIAEADRVLQEQQLAEARAAVPGTTVREALAAGWVSQAALGAPTHLLRGVRQAGDGTTFTAGRPLMLLVTSDDPSSEVLAVVYWVQSPHDSPPEGFAGEQDQWHWHGMVCRTGADVVSADEDPSMTAEACAAAGGQVLSNGGWMLHAWVVPGSESPTGQVFELQASS